MLISEGKNITIVYGDHADEMKEVSNNLKKALDYAANDHQKEMLKCYIKHFEEGNVEDHKGSK